MPIDLHSRHPGITEQDFLLLDQKENHQKWDAISLSLVLNFVPVPSDRGGFHYPIFFSMPKNNNYPPCRENAAACT